MQSENNTNVPNIKADVPNFRSSASLSYNSFDLAKFVCSILVVMLHFPLFGIQSGSSIPAILNFIIHRGIGRIAVPLFFVFSGFLLYRKVSLDNFSIQPIKKYVLRIFTLYIIWTLIYLPLNLVNIISSAHPLSKCLYYLRRFFFIGTYYHLWYLRATVIGVIIISFLLSRRFQPRKILCIAFAFWIVGLLGNNYYGLIRPLTKVPYLSQIIKYYFKIFGNTRNGAFFAFFYLALGMVFAKEDISLSRKKSLPLFLASLVMMVLESLFISNHQLAKGHDLLFFAAPAAFFCFLFLKSVSLEDRPIYKSLRTLSSLIYYLHVWIGVVISNMFKLLNPSLTHTPLTFLTTLALTILLAQTIIHVSHRPKLQWLKKIY